MRTSIPQVRCRPLARASTAAMLALLAAPVAHADEPDFEPDRVFVRLQPGASIAAINQAYETTVVPGESIPSRGMYLLDLPPGASESTYVSLLRNDPRVLRAEFNVYVVDENPSGTTRRMYLGVHPSIYQTDLTPHIINAPAAWSQSKGRGVIVAIIDTGVDASHPALAPAIDPRGFNFVTNSPITLDVARNVDTNQNGISDELVGHGTMVAGLVLRVAPDASILPIVAMDSDGFATISRIAQGLYHALDNGAHVANLSMGSEQDPPLLREVLADVRSQGLLVIASAGNRANSNPDFPAGASDAGVLAVAATDDADIRAPFSNYGSWVALSAPGVDVVAPVPDNAFGVGSGTSLASPLVAGAAANLRAICPLATPQQVITLLQQRSVPIDTLNPDFAGELGAGRLDAARAVGAIGPALPCDCDQNDDGVVTREDLYRVLVRGVDANLDGVSNAQDLRDLAAHVRATERSQLLQRP